MVCSDGTPRSTIHSAAPFYSVLIRINPYNPGSVSAPQSQDEVPARRRSAKYAAAAIAASALCGGLTVAVPPLLACQDKLGRLLLLRHPGLAQAGEISGLGKSANLRIFVTAVGYQASDAGIGTGATQSAGFLEFRRSPVNLAPKSVGGAKVSVNKSGWIAVSRFFEPKDRFVNSRL